jgi:hypothetical protein
MLFNNCWSFERRMAIIQLLQFVYWLQRHHSAFSHVTEQSLHLLIQTSSRWRVQEVYPWSPVAADIIMNLSVRDQVCLVAATNALLSNSSAPAGCRQASTVLAGRPSAGRNKAVAHRMCSVLRVCTSMCPLNQDQKSAVKRNTGMSSVYMSIYLIWEFHTE